MSILADLVARALLRLVTDVVIYGKKFGRNGRCWEFDLPADHDAGGVIYYVMWGDTPDTHGVMMTYRQPFPGGSLALTSLVNGCPIMPYVPDLD